jgi:TorA maturation chaperone TorD
LARHLGVWIAPFCRNIQSHANTDFYRTLGDVTLLFVGNEQTAVYDLGDAYSAGKAEV